MAIRIKAFQVAEAIQLKGFRSAFAGNLVTGSPTELFYGPESDSPPEFPRAYLYVLNFGVVIFAGYDDIKISELLEFVKRFAQIPLENSLTEEFLLHEGDSLRFGYNDLSVPELNVDVLRITMLNVGQSVALDYYDLVTDELLAAPNRFVGEMEQYGRLKASRKTVLRYIGKTMAVRNRIIENLYVMDAPEITWNNEYLDKIDNGLKKTFDIKVRFRSLDFQLDIISNNLELFSNILQHRESSFLEWIIIILILVEVVNLFLEQLF